MRIQIQRYRDMTGTIIVLCTVCTAYLVSANKYISGVFSTTDKNILQRMVINKNTGSIYVGAVNRIYQLSSSLAQEAAVRTGPKSDYNHAVCDSYNGNKICPNHTTDSYSKALVIDYRNEKLISCSNIGIGTCVKWSLANITIQDPVTNKGIVPFDNSSQAVMYIANGPYRDNSKKPDRVLYVAATRSTVGFKAYRDLIPSLCSRNLNNFRLYRQDIGLSTKKEVEYQQRDTFRIKYIAGFSSNGFSYFMAVQKESLLSSENVDYVTRIMRVCQSDTKYHSYTEIPLQCKYRGGYYNILQAAVKTRVGIELAESLGIPEEEDVLFALFSSSIQYTDQPTNESVLCMYPLRYIQSMFTTNIRQCFAGVGNLGPSHFVSVTPCSKLNFSIDDNYCGEHDINGPVNGREPVEGQAVLHIADRPVTSLAVSVTFKSTVVFIGCNDGYIIKAVVESKARAFKYGNFTIGEETKVKHIEMAQNPEYMYTLTDKKIMKIRVHDCTRFKACNTCRSARDPYCGWCTLERRCTLREECPDYTVKRRWVPYTETHCTNITRVVPDKIKLKKLQTLTLSVRNLPRNNGEEYKCVFSYPGFPDRETQATLAPVPDGQRDDPDTFTCDTPPSHMLPAIPTGKDHFSMQLSIKVLGSKFVFTTIIFFDCQVHNSCTSCTNSYYPCTWCVKRHMCVNNHEQCDRDDRHVNGLRANGGSDSRGPEYCPKISSVSSEILVPSGTSMTVSVAASNLQDFQTEFKCLFSIEGRVHRTLAKASISRNGIECQSFEFTYHAGSKMMNVPYKVVWVNPSSKELALDNPDNIQVKVYKCDVMAANCGQCLNIEHKFKCGWCERSCSIQSSCHHRWLDYNSDCPNPEIKRFYPVSGPVKGGTAVTIEGVNLGKRFEEIEHEVDIAGIKCIPIKNKYINATRIVCVTQQSFEEKEGFVNVVVNRRYRGISKQKFNFVEPDIISIHPMKGPQSGGTRVTLTGQNLNTGSSAKVNILGEECPIHERSDTTVVFSTNGVSDAPIYTAPSVQIDKAQITAPADFQYTLDPTISSVDPKSAILSGGRPITVTGSYLDSVQEPKLYMKVNDTDVTGDCNVQDSDHMVCESPYVKLLLLETTGTNFHTVSFGFLMDGVEPVRNLTDHLGPEYKFNFFIDPAFEAFEETKFFQSRGGYVTINGKDLNYALSKSDVTVKIGEGHCNVTSISQTQLTCEPPKPGSPGYQDKGLVTVTIGKNFTVIIGEFVYEGPGGFLKMPAIIGIASAGGFILLLVIICSAVFTRYRRKLKESDRERKRMQNQMDALETKVAKECREAFAELQTEMTELTEQSGPLGIPFRDYRNFCMRVLYPTEKEDHPVTRRLEVDPARMESVSRGLKMFDQHLLQNKTFLLTFIRTLESSHAFSMREKVNLASLISVCLQGRMEYFTDILKTLLSELIERNMEGKNNPKLLLRRTESVAEKMLTNWFTFLLSKFLKECAGEPLYMLYRAIKQQLDKGPVDAVTSEAKYSLREDKLIRQQMDYKMLTLKVVDPDNQYMGEPHLVKVLDCDTISQVKEKILDAIYKNTPCSARSDKDDLDLEWRHGERGRHLLQDEDMTSKADGGFKYLNTLAHYRVHDGAMMALVPRQVHSMYNAQTISSSRNALFYDDSFSTYVKMQGSPSSTLSPNSNYDMETGDMKYFHLVKPHDSEAPREGDRGSKMVSEIYLTRLLATKGTLQQYVDDLFETIFSINHRGSALPLAIKYMFDFLDDQALNHNIQDPEVVHTWKSNSLPLRFWVNVIKNPDFVFDVHKSPIVDVCLSVVAQIFMDSCSLAEHRLGKDSPSSKLLYAKDIPKYKQWVDRYYQDIKMMPQISDQDMNAILAEESRTHSQEFVQESALYELYMYVDKYFDPIMDNLHEDEFARQYRLLMKLQNVQSYMDYPGDSVV